jgi:hypothetical protein
MEGDRMHKGLQMTKANENEVDQQTVYNMEQRMKLSTRLLAIEEDYPIVVECSHQEAQKGHIPRVNKYEDIKS